jgi:preprotein translocase subunit SecY
LGNGISIIIFAGMHRGAAERDRGLFELARTGAMHRFTALVICILVCRDGVRGVRRARPAQDPGQLRQAPGGQQDLRGSELAPAAQAEHGGRDSADLRVEHHLFPATLAQWFGSSEGMILAEGLGSTLAPGQPIYVILYAAAIVFFCFFYTALQSSIRRRRRTT